MKKDLNYIARLEQAIAKKYGEETIQNPRATWTQEKEQKYLKEIKQIYKEELQNNTSDEKIQANGFFVSKKLLTNKEDRTCPACFVYSFDRTTIVEEKNNGNSFRNCKRHLTGAR